MPRGDKSKYTEKQKRQAEHIEEGYEKRGVGEGEAARRAWSTVNKTTGGAKKVGGSGRGKAINTAPAKKGGKKGGAASAARPAAARSASAKKAAQTRARNKAGASTSRSTASRSSAAR
ncbi:MAG TPA: plasmid stabilization protein [Gammaproteobacteria bacterium]|nr:plasmid stabilization protein [Gammaproteobacteria bacterium]